MSEKIHYSIGDCRLYDAAAFCNENGMLHVLEQKSGLPFAAQRVFYVHVDGPATRGRHAHRRCSQLLVCLSGRVEVTLEDGAGSREVKLDRPSQALLIQPGIWGEQRYLDKGSILLVLCDQPYDEADYIRDHDAFLAYRADKA